MKSPTRARINKALKRLGIRYYGRSEDGDTLIEVLLALIVLSLATVSLLVAFGTVISASAEHRTLTNYDTALETASQLTISAMQQDVSLFTSVCPLTSATLSTYPGYTYGITLPAPYSSFDVQYATLNPIQFWNSTTGTFTPTCVENVPQLITLQVEGTSYQNSFVVNFPLGSTPPTNTTPVNETLSIINSPPSGAGVTNGNAGLPLTNYQPIVEVADSYGVVTTDLSPAAIFITPVGGATGTLSGCVGNEVEGVITFGGCTISAAGTYTMSATDGNLISSNSVTVVVGGPGNELVFTTQPVGGPSGSALATQPVITVENPNTGNSTVTSYNGTITLSASGGILSGSRT